MRNSEYPLISTVIWSHRSVRGSRRFVGWHGSDDENVRTEITAVRSVAKYRKGRKPVAFIPSVLAGGGVILCYSIKDTKNS